MNFLKAFDRLDWDFIPFVSFYLQVYSALYKFGYEDKFIHMTEAGYTNIQSKTKVNDLLSDPFTLTWGVHQACPLSILLYITATEVLAIFIDADTRIKRVQIGDHEIKQ